MLKMYVSEHPQLLLMQLCDATEDLSASTSAVNDMDALQEDIKGLKSKVKMLKVEHRRIKSEVSASADAQHI